MNKVKCECGHVNPYGTELCESCGKPLAESSREKKLLNMRYDGVARRSQTYNTTVIDKIWNFFSSVKVGIWIIVLILVASSVGTIFPQEMYIPGNVSAARYYEEEYGWIGQLYYQLGFHNLYGSWWYMALIASLGVSLIICSLDRVVPLYRALKTQRVTRHEAFLKKQRLFAKQTVENEEEAFKKVKQILKDKKYNIREENGNLLAEKGRFSRWGPYVNHIGLIIFLFGAMLRFFPGMYVDDHVWVREGEREVISGTDGQYYIENEEFFIELYDEDDEVYREAIERAGQPQVKTYQTNAVIYEKENTDTVGLGSGELEEVTRGEIRVNEPLVFGDDFGLYQTDYKLNELNEMSFHMQKKGADEPAGTFSIDLFDPQDEYDLGEGYKVKVNSYFPNFYFDDDNQPSTQNSIPDNPAFIFELISPEHPEEGEFVFIGIQQNYDVFGENDYEVRFAGVETKDVTALTVRKDKTLPFLAIGGAIFMIGVVQGAYWAHRRIWVQRKGGEIWLAAHTNKHWEALKKELSTMTDETGLPMPVDQVQEEKQKK